jgi:hypothetical protein
LDIEAAGQAMMEKLDGLMVFCPSKEQGCQWIGFRAALAHHIAECGFLTVSCGCKENILRKNLPTHLRECMHRPVICDRCETKVAYREIEDHIDICEFEPVPCHFCFEMLPRNELSSHIIAACPESSIECPLKRFGCTWSGKRVKAAEHEAECPLSPVSAFLLEQEQENKRLFEANAQLKQQQAEMMKSMTQIGSELELLRSSVVPAIERLNVENARLANVLVTNDVRMGVEVNQLRGLVQLSLRQSESNHGRRLSDERAVKL